MRSSNCTVGERAPPRRPTATSPGCAGQGSRGRPRCLAGSSAATCPPGARLRVPCPPRGGGSRPFLPATPTWHGGSTRVCAVLSPPDHRRGCSAASAAQPEFSASPGRRGRGAGSGRSQAAVRVPLVRIGRSTGQIASPLRWPSRSSSRRVESSREPVRRNRVRRAASAAPVRPAVLAGSGFTRQVVAFRRRRRGRPSTGGARCEAVARTSDP